MNNKTNEWHLLVSAFGTSVKDFNERKEKGWFFENALLESQSSWPKCLTT